MRIVAISDTHNFKVRDLPEGDVIVHAGDATNRGNFSEITRFMAWFRETLFAHKIFVAGNHDFYFQDHPVEAKLLMAEAGIIYLQDESVTIDGVKFYGSPWQPEFYDWAFNLPRGPKLAEKWAMIPDAVDVLVTHGPAWGILDQVNGGPHLGCEDLGRRVMALNNLKLHVFGHIHDGYGRLWTPGQRYVAINAAQCTERYALLNKPIVEEI